MAGQRNFATGLRIFLWAGFLLSLYQIRAEKNYDGYVVLKVDAPTDSARLALRSLHDDQDEIDMFKMAARSSPNAQILVPPNKVKEVEEYLKKKNLKLLAKRSGKVTTKVDGGMALKRRSMSGIIPLTWDKYYPYENIMDFLNFTANQYPNLARLSVIGKTLQEREIQLLQLGTNADNPGIYMQSLIHAREWLTGATVTYFIHTLTSEYKNDPEVKNLLDTFNLYIVPVVNPDGYHHSVTEDRYWRKNRNPDLPCKPKCVGVDLNRNYDYQWTMAKKCTIQEFPGCSAASEPENVATTSFVLDKKDSIKASIDVHAYGQMILFPYGYTTKLPADNKDHMAWGKAIADKLKSMNPENEFKYGSISQVLYEAKGASVDFYYQNGIKYATTIEVQGDDFVYPEDRVAETVKENYQGLMTACMFVVNKTNKS